MAPVACSGCKRVRQDDIEEEGASDVDVRCSGLGLGERLHTSLLPTTASCDNEKRNATMSCTHAGIKRKCSELGIRKGKWN